MTRRRRPRPRAPEPLSLYDKFWLVFGGVVMPVVFLGILIGAPLRFGPAWRAQHGQGVAGVFVAVHESCSRSCSWFGDFSSDAGAKIQRDVLLIGGSPQVPGDRVPAIDAGGGGVVYARSGNSEWIAIPIVMAISLAYLAVWLVAGIWWLRDRRKHLKESTPAVSGGAAKRKRKSPSK